MYDIDVAMAVLKCLDQRFVNGVMATCNMFSKL